MNHVADLVAEVTAPWGPLEWLTITTWGLIGVFVATELVVLAERDPRNGPRRHREAAMAAGALLVGVAYGAVFAMLWSAVGSIAPRGFGSFWDRHRLLAAVCAFILWDFSGWIYHLIGHRTRSGWAAHSPHHSGSAFDATLALRLTWMPWHGLAHHCLIALAGFRLEVILGALAVSNLLQALQHSRCMPQPPRWLAAVIMTSGAHRHHHGPDGARRNLGPVFTIWDRLAGTWWPPALGGEPDRAAEPPAPTPTPAPTPAPTPKSGTRGAVAIEVAGWARLLGAHGAREAHPEPREAAPR